jgi:hypothetical protein
VAESAEPYREFIREMTLRIERAMREMVRESREERRILREELRDLREESQAQTKALLRMLDRLDGGGASPAT